MPPDPMFRSCLVSGGADAPERMSMEIGHVGLAVMAWLMIVSLVGAVLTAVVTQWDM